MGSRVTGGHQKRSPKGPEGYGGPPLLDKYRRESRAPDVSGAVGSVSDMEVGHWTHDVRRRWNQEKKACKCIVTQCMAWRCGCMARRRPLACTAHLSSLTRRPLGESHSVELATTSSSLVALMLGRHGAGDGARRSVDSVAAGGRVVESHSSSHLRSDRWRVTGECTRRSARGSDAGG